MQATVIYNPNAGSVKKVPPSELETALREAGYTPVLHETKDEAELGELLHDVSGLIIPVGGDGTLRAVALQLLQRKDVELAYLPAGSANNLGHSMGLADLDWRELVAALPHAQPSRLDVGRVRGPLGEHHFLEAFGAGVYADLLARYDPEQGKSVLRTIGALLDVLPKYEPQSWRLTLDGQEVSGSYVMLEALNTPMAGPHLRLAPRADPTDGLLDVVLVAASERENLLGYARRLQKGALGELQNVVVTRCKRLELVWTGYAVHVDAVPHCEPAPDGRGHAKNVVPELADEKHDVIAVEAIPGALTLRIPQAAVARVAA